ncbi:MAG: hypothetical protein BAJALOKI3v1_110070 [Promethearchaeota archaeon]|nr:MAG: hypothetical protein BAJALOKI3v1_110070 [Candidatus Lokiarchaeota archaeon]
MKILSKSYYLKFNNPSRNFKVLIILDIDNLPSKKYNKDHI